MWTRAGHYTVDHRPQLARQWNKCDKLCLEWIVRSHSTRGWTYTCFTVEFTCMSAIRQWRSLNELVFSTSADSWIRSPDTYPRRQTRSSTLIGPPRKHIRPGLNSPRPPIGRCSQHTSYVIDHVYRHTDTHTCAIGYTQYIVNRKSTPLEKCGENGQKSEIKCLWCKCKRDDTVVVGE